MANPTAKTATETTTETIPEASATAASDTSDNSAADTVADTIPDTDTLKASEQGLYLYCFCYAQPPLPWLEGLPEHPAPQLLVYQDLAAVLSVATTAKYRPSRRNVLRHHEVIAARMQQSPVLPLRFGSVAPSLTALQRLLQQQAATLREQLEALRGYAEYALTLSWADEQAAAQQLGQHDPTVQAYRQRAQRQGGQLGYHESIQVGERVAQLLSQAATHQQQDLQRLCQQHAYKVLELESKESQTISRLSLLMEPAHYPALLRDLERFDQHYEQHYSPLRLSLSDPLPPFSFSDMQLHWQA